MICLHLQLMEYTLDGTKEIVLQMLKKMDVIAVKIVEDGLVKKNFQELREILMEIKKQILLHLEIQLSTGLKVEAMVSQERDQLIHKHGAKTKEVGHLTICILDT